MDLVVAIQAKKYLEQIDALNREIKEIEKLIEHLNSDEVKDDYEVTVGESGYAASKGSFSAHRIYKGFTIKNTNLKVVKAIVDEVHRKVVGELEDVKEKLSKLT
jgi:flagella basal body P-ring formation protein FlgA